jgi:general secretion pathway protein L
MLREVGIEPAFLTPEMMALPLQPSRRSVLLAENLAFVRSEAQDGFVLEVESLPMLLAGWEDKDREQVADVLLFRCDTEAILPDEVKSLIAEEQPVSEPLSLLAGGFDEKTAINLLQGFYSPHAQWELHWNRWRLPAVLLLVFMVFQVGLQVRDYFQLRNYNQLLSAQIEQVYRQAFPDADRIVNPRAQMEHRLQSLRGTGEGEHNGFLALLGQAGPLLVAAENFHLRGLRYRENDLDLDFEIKDLRGLETLKDGLTAQGLAVDIRTATTRGDRVQARLQVKEARP